MIRVLDERTQTWGATRNFRSSNHFTQNRIATPEDHCRERPNKNDWIAALGLQLEEGDAVAAKCDLDGGGRGNGCRGWSCGHIRARINR